MLLASLTGDFVNTNLMMKKDLSPKVIGTDRYRIESHRHRLVLVLDILDNAVWGD
jgi:hypothetical protein